MVGSWCCVRGGESDGKMDREMDGEMDGESDGKMDVGDDEMGAWLGTLDTD